MLQIRGIDLESLAEALNSGFDGYDAFYWWNPKIKRVDFWTTDLDGERPDVDGLGVITIEALDSREGYRTWTCSHSPGTAPQRAPHGRQDENPCR